MIKLIFIYDHVTESEDVNLKNMFKVINTKINTRHTTVLFAFEDFMGVILTPKGSKY